MLWYFIARRWMAGVHLTVNVHSPAAGNMFGVFLSRAFSYMINYFNMFSKVVGLCFEMWLLCFLPFYETFKIYII